MDPNQMDQPPSQIGPKYSPNIGQKNIHWAQAWYPEQNIQQRAQGECA